MTASFAQLLRVDAELSAAGVPALTPWWRPTLERFYAHSTAKTLVARVGRGGAKSHTAAKVGLTEVVAGKWNIAPGEIHYFAFVSVNKSEAAQRLNQLESWLRILRIPADRSGDEIVLRDRPLGFRVFACSVGSVSGFRCVGFSNDELAKQLSDPEYTDPATEVLASLQAMTVTHPQARKLLISSPVGKQDEHARRFDLGDTNFQLVAAAPSWVANPDGITEQATRDLEPDPRIWAREYAALPQDSVLAAFPSELIDAALGRRPADGMIACPPVTILDPASGGADAFTWGICRHFVENELEVNLCHRVEDNRIAVSRRVDGSPVRRIAAGPPVKPHIVFEHVDGATGGVFADVDSVVRQVRAASKRYGSRTCHADQREAFALTSLFQKVGMRYIVHDWTGASKPMAVELVRRWLADGILCLPRHKQLESELRSFEERINPSGQITFAGRGRSHDDHVALLVTAALVCLSKQLSLGPNDLLGHTFNFDAHGNFYLTS